MTLSVLILGSLINESMSGYDVHKKYCREEEVNLWPATHQQVYRECNRLLDKGYLQSEIVCQEGRPDRKVYELTPSGINEFQDRMLDSLSDLKFRSSEIVALMFAPLLPEDKREQLWEKMECRRERLTQHLASLEQRISDFDCACCATEKYGRFESVLRLKLVMEKMARHHELEVIDRVQMELVG